MKKEIDIGEASSIIFPVFFNILEERRFLKEAYFIDSNLDKKIKKWAKINLEILNEFYPQDIFTGVSGDKGPKAVVLIRKILMKEIKNETKV